jgi:hypothetical protein
MRSAQTERRSQGTDDEQKKDARHAIGSAKGWLVDQAKFQIKAVATKRIIFLVQNSKRVGRDSTPPVPETFAIVDGRMVDGRADGRG